MGREKSYGQDYNPTLVDRFGCWLSMVKIRTATKKKGKIGLGGNRKKLLDLGSGYHMALSGQMTKEYDVTAVDLALNQEILPQIMKIEGPLEHVLPALRENEYSFIIFNSVMEHLIHPQEALNELYRILEPDGTVFLNVPTWRGKWFLEYSAFRLHTSPASEMNDHKMYYDKRILWPMLVKSGFLPENIQLHYHKFGLNVYAVCTKVKA